MYHFGHLFKYGDDDKDIPNNEEYILVYPKYSSVKQELVLNEFATLTIEQFNNEYLKCQHHFMSLYRKRNYPNMFVENLLTLMIYSNCTSFTSHFQKTYRENTNKHNNFFYFAMYLKLSVLRFGTRIGNGTIKSFYHGISAKLAFPQIIGGHMHGLKIFCPLSTTPSFAVAIQFANRGLVVEFGAHQPTNSNAKYFALSWCSDFGYEDEYLLVYNGYGLEINNIIECSSGTKYVTILDTLRFITDCTQYFKYEKHLLTYSFTRNVLDENQIIPPGIIELCTEYHLNGKYLVGQRVSSSMLALATAIIEGQLSHSLSKYKPFRSLSDYGKKMVDIYCKNVECLEIDYYERMQYPSLFALIFYGECEWIQINEINVLFPNVKEIRVKNVRLCVTTMDNILFHLNNEESNKSKLAKIVIQAKPNSNLSVVNAVKKYEQRFKDIKFNITKYRDWLYVLQNVEVDGL